MKNKALFIVRILFGLFMANSGLSKFTHHMSTPEVPEAADNLMNAFAESGWMIPLIAIAEIVGGILIAIPKYEAIGALILLPVFIGIVLFNIVLAPDQAIMSIVLFIVLGWILFENKNKYEKLINK